MFLSLGTFQKGYKPKDQRVARVASSSFVNHPDGGWKRSSRRKGGVISRGYQRSCLFVAGSSRSNRVWFRFGISTSGRQGVRVLDRRHNHRRFRLLLFQRFCAENNLSFFVAHWITFAWRGALCMRSRGLWGFKHVIQCGKGGFFCVLSATGSEVTQQ